MRFLLALFLVVVTGTVMSVHADQVQFARDIRPILSDKCFFCHGPDEGNREADLRLDLEQEAGAVIVAGDAEASDLVERITSNDSDLVMPPA